MTLCRLWIPCLPPTQVEWNTENYRKKGRLKRGEQWPCYNRMEMDKRIGLKLIEIFQLYWHFNPQVMYAALDALVGAHLLLALSTQLWQGSGRLGYPSYSTVPPPPLLPLLMPQPLWYSHLTTLLRLTCLPHLDCRFKISKKQKCEYGLVCNKTEKMYVVKTFIYCQIIYVHYVAYSLEELYLYWISQFW